MNTLEFSVGNAMGHFRKTGGPKGFLWKYALAYALIGIVVQGLSLYLMAPIYGAAFNPIHFPGGPGLIRDITQLRGRGLHAIGQLVVADPAGDLRVVHLCETMPV